MINFGNPTGLDFQIKDRLILLGYRGSIAHGTYISPKENHGFDDKDTMGIFIPPVEYYFGLKNIETIEWKYQEFDNVMYELRKMLNLLMKANPNVLALLYLEPQYYLYKDWCGDLLIENRHLFSTKMAYYSFIGYARSQLHRMTHWNKEKAFKQGYMGEKRKVLVENFGYDIKNASHLIRLLRMGIEFMSTGELKVLRQDAQELIEIKKGEWSLEKVKKESERLFDLSEKSLVNSQLPNKPDFKEIQKLSIKMFEYYFGRELLNESEACC